MNQFPATAECFPSDWREMQLARTVEGCVNGIWGEEPTGADDDVVVLRVADFDRNALRVSLDKLTLRSISASERRQRSLRSGDLLIEKSGGGERQLVGQVVLFEHEFDAVTSNFVARMRVRPGVDSRYLTYVFAHLYSRKINLRSIKQNTGIQNLDSGQYLREHFLFPTNTVQVRLADFLDIEIARIDILLEKQKQLVGFLKEKRQAVISQAVTKGLNLDVPMKDSGVEWLGEVPSHWEVVRSRRLFAYITSGSRDWGDFYSDDGEFFARIANVSSESIEPKFHSIVRVALPEKAEGMRSKVADGDILITITAELGSICVASGDLIGGYVSQHLALCRPNDAVESARWLGFALAADSSRSQFALAGYGGTKTQLSLEDVREIALAVPPAAEQAELANYIDGEVARADALVSSTAEFAELLDERRAALISAAVTGQIDVTTYDASRTNAASLA